MSICELRELREKRCKLRELDALHGLADLTAGWEDKLMDLQEWCANIKIEWDASRIYWVACGTMPNGRVWSVANTSIPWAICNAHRMVKDHVIGEASYDRG